METVIVQKEAITVALQFLSRVELKGAEAPTYMQLIQLLQAALTTPAEEPPTDDS